MPITLNVSITLTDAQLSEIRGAPPVVVTPPVVVVPPVVVPPEVPVETPVAKPHFGYYGAGENQEAETVDHTSFTFAPGWDGSGLPLTRPTVLFAPGGDPLDAVLAKVKAQGGLHHIIALYPQDEPAENNLNESQTIAKFEAARAAARAVGLNPPPPIMVCYGRKGTPGIANADIIGQDWYENGPQWIPLARSDQKRFFIPGAANPWREDVMQFADAALSDAHCWGVVSFIWLDQWGGTQHLGVRSNGLAQRHREAYAKLGWVPVAPVTPPVVVPPVVTPTTALWEVMTAPHPTAFPCWWSAGGATFYSQAEMDSYAARVTARNKALWEQNQATANTRYSGPFPAASLSEADCRYLYYVSEAKNDGAIYYKLLSGYHVDISRAINRGFDLNNGYSGAATDGVSASMLAAVAAYYVLPK